MVIKANKCIKLNTKKRRFLKIFTTLLRPGSHFGPGFRTKLLFRTLNVKVYQWKNKIFYSGDIYSSMNSYVLKLQVFEQLDLKKFNFSKLFSTPETIKKVLENWWLTLKTGEWWIFSVNYNSYVFLSFQIKPYCSKFKILLLDSTKHWVRDEWK